MYGASDGPIPMGAEELLPELLELWLAPPPVLLLWLWLVCDGPELPELPAAQAPAMKQSEKIPVKAMGSGLLSIVKLSRLPLSAATVQ